LDAGAVLAFARGDRRVGALLKAAREAESDVVVPPAIVTQTVRGGPRDAPVLRLINATRVPFVGLRLARRAGELPGAAGLSDVADAQVVAEALRAGPSTVVTSDPEDMSTLAGTEAGRSVMIVPL